ncbi:basic salivary proline-rich protein 4-like [Sciurus carolinensis]|uniref:basic salivary proline-rich protein 4-like n=1 Tax=Sciurus carolinensis TaxID=30640 RepID=UPI001FB55AFB|nr:basic salivary proline-rich protein 4-like [Sciurus carolinensis]
MAAKKPGAPGAQPHCPPSSFSRKVQPGNLSNHSTKGRRDEGRGGRGKPPPAPPPQLVLLPEKWNESRSPPTQPYSAGPAGLPPVSPRLDGRATATPERVPGPQEGPRDAGRAREAATLGGRAWATQELRRPRVGSEGRGDGPADWGTGAAAVGTGSQTQPRCPAAHLLQAACGARRGASGDQLLSRPPLYSGSISGGAAYARCQSPASRSGGGRPGGGEPACGDRNGGSDTRGQG